MEIIEKMRSKARYLNGTLSLLDANLAADITQWADQIATDYAALEAERDELQRRLDAVVALLEPGETPKRTFFDFHETYIQDHRRWKLKNELHANALAIAEGRDK